MADLLPSSPDPSAGDGGEPRVVGVDSDDAEDLLAALQSETARDLLAVLYDDPATPSTLAEEVDTSIQNVRYHLERLTDAELVEVADTVYSEKGREMKVYAPSAKPLVVFAGGEDDAPGLEAALSRLLGGLGILGLSSLLVQRLFGGGGGTVVDLDFQGQSGGDSAAAPTTTENASGAGPNGGSGTETARSGGEATTAEAATTADSGQPTTTAAEADAVADTTAETARTVTEQTVEATTTVAEAGDAGMGAVGGLPPGLAFFAGGVVVLLALGVAWYLSAR